MKPGDRVRHRRKPTLMLILIAGAVISISTVFAATVTVTSQKLTAVGTTGLSFSNPPVSTCTISPSESARVEEANPTTNYASNFALEIQTKSADNNRAFVKFTTQNCNETGATIPATSSIVSATLNLFMYTAPTTSRTHSIYRVTGTIWGEGTLTWNNQPAVATSATSSVATGTTAGVWKGWDITADIRSIRDGGVNRGWMLRDASENSGTLYSGWFCTARNGTSPNCINGTNDDPYLSITYQPATDTCTFSATQDSYARSDMAGTNTNTGYLWVGTGTTNYRTFVKFDTSSACEETGAAIPFGASTLSASFDLFVQSAPGSSRTYQAHRVTATWTETTPTWTWSNAGGNVSGTVTATTATGTTTGVWNSWDVTSDVSAFLSGSASDYGWMLRDSAEGNASAIKTQYCPREGGTGCSTVPSTDTAPRLVVTYMRPYINTCTLIPTADSYVDEDNPTTNFDAGNLLDVRGNDSNFGTPIYGIYRALVQFNVSSASSGNCVETGAPLPATSTVWLASLQLYDFSPPVTSETQQLYRLSASWTEGTVTYNNQPTVPGGTPGSTFVETTAGTQSWDVTTEVRSFWNGSLTNYGWRIFSANETLGTGDGRSTSYCGKNGGNAACITSGPTYNGPKLVIQYH